MSQRHWANRTYCTERVLARPERDVPMAEPHTNMAPAWSSTSAWHPARVVCASRTRAMFVCRVL
eukprot:5153509-Prymnesium_polylepis.1